MQDLLEIDRDPADTKLESGRGRVRYGTKRRQHGNRRSANGCQADSAAATRSVPAAAGERGWRMTMSMSRPSVVRRRSSRSGEHSRKSPLSSREASGCVRPSSRAASSWVMQQRRMIVSMRTTGSALTTWASASGRPRSVKMFPLLVSTAVSETFVALQLDSLRPCSAVRRPSCGADPAELLLRCGDHSLRLLPEGMQDMDRRLETDGMDGP